MLFQQKIGLGIENLGLKSAWHHAVRNVYKAFSLKRPRLHIQLQNFLFSLKRELQPFSPRLLLPKTKKRDRQIPTHLRLSP